MCKACTNCYRFVVVLSSWSKCCQHNPSISAVVYVHCRCNSAVTWPCRYLHPWCSWMYVRRWNMRLLKTWIILLSAVLKINLRSQCPMRSSFGEVLSRRDGIELPSHSVCSIVQYSGPSDERPPWWEATLMRGHPSRQFEPKMCFLHINTWTTN